MARSAAIGALAILAACSAAANELEAVAESMDADLVIEPTALHFDGEITQGGWIRGFLPDGTVSAMLDGEEVDFAYDHAFFAAFDRDAGGSATLVVRLADGTEIR
ncbi:MAG TPA: M23 family peptidase, partial [Sphingomonadaceae bacterium]|nr:M23 family peptidase [Sphingomonadaceae bacterium]